MARNTIGIAPAPAVFKADISPVHPPQALHPLAERYDAPLRFDVALRGADQNGHLPYGLALPSARRERPRAALGSITEERMDRRLPRQDFAGNLSAKRRLCNTVGESIGRIVEGCAAYCCAVPAARSRAATTTNLARSSLALVLRALFGGAKELRAPSRS